MILRIALPAAGLLLLGACATGRDVPPDYLGTLRTETPAPDVLACVEQVVGVAGTASGTGTVVEAASAPIPRRYTVASDKGETTVLMQGAYVAGGAPVDQAVTRCLVTTAPPAAAR